MHWCDKDIPSLGAASWINVPSGTLPEEQFSCICTGDGCSVRAQPNHAFPELWKDVNTSESRLLLIKGKKQFPTMTEEETFFRGFLGFFGVLFGSCFTMCSKMSP